MKPKVKIIMSTLILLSSITSLFLGSIVYAESNEPIPNNYVISSKKITPYVIEIKTVSNLELYKNNNSEEVSVLTMDFTDAKFFDEYGKLVDKNKVMETMKPISQTFGAGSSGGSWQTGSGYAVCKGMRVSGNSGMIGLQVSYKVDFQNLQRNYDRLDRVYGATVDGSGTWTWINNGVFRSQEQAGYSAYGGIKGQWTVNWPGLPGGTSTKYLYFRVGNDTYWLDHNL
ncbi:hypothetical protein [Enterococcus sp. AZ149]|uniref:hypothetical protein n=1 Tax=Enterococcus sp. AZ149 TaxID=2774686 RepID=UPI003F283949